MKKSDVQEQIRIKYGAVWGEVYINHGTWNGSESCYVFPLDLGICHGFFGAWENNDYLYSFVNTMKEEEHRQEFKRVFNLDTLTQDVPIPFEKLSGMCVPICVSEEELGCFLSVAYDALAGYQTLFSEEEIQIAMEDLKTHVQMQLNMMTQSDETSLSNQLASVSISGVNKENLSIKNT